MPSFPIKILSKGQTMNRIYYTGICSKKIPEPEIELMTKLSNKLEREGLILRTSECKETDTSFSKGVIEPRNKETYKVLLDGEIVRYYLNDEEIYLTTEALGSVYEYGLDISNLSLEEKANLSLAYYQVLGYKEIDNLIYQAEPVLFIIYWTEDEAGMIGQVLRIASNLHIKIPILNLKLEEDRLRVERYISNEISLEQLYL